jgi:hypothetical protein
MKKSLRNFKDCLEQPYEARSLDIPLEKFV